jgi:hypothetical protein
MIMGDFFAPGVAGYTVILYVFPALAKVLSGIQSLRGFDAKLAVR